MCLSHINTTTGLFIFSNIINKPLGGFPTKAGIGNGFSINTAAYLLTALFNIAFNHDTLYKLMNIRTQLPAVHNLFDNTDLLCKFLIGIAVICINECGRML